MITRQYHISQISQIARWLSQLLANSTIIVFEGSMGTGKTTLIRALCKLWKVDSGVSSPTFSLVNAYKTIYGELIYHFDFYRLRNEEEALDIGIEEYFESGNRCLIEWAEKIPNLLPSQYTKIQLQTTTQPDVRTLTFQHYG
ncbi:MAG: tRNA (adenosine(37)-N6)-threonylcarbamoyltransferase complex ATPase subunit type 1 TsaE [Cytophagales bacterium]|nr:tRNA (adenosine(37)-N6)-threonylcarbamoyltransferase complex ATPase subunit type 1 TsaE [Cytophagales bacterium]MDW8383713.1 tRNA (adenosine(37)-N6)-threonylcarbamoyltransferase complex ATPase subunit type 1 TsaE [Flammeovirgaceae bacterium]